MDELAVMTVDPVYFHLDPVGGLAGAVDWTKVDRRWSSDSGVINVPLSNKNLLE